MAGAQPVYPDLQPDNERSALIQRLDQYRAIAVEALVGVPLPQASTRLLPATDLTIAGVVRHLAWAEDRWFQGRLLGAQMPAPWDRPGADDPDHAMRLAPDDTVEGVVDLYDAACKRSRFAADQCNSLDHVAAVSSFGRGPVNLRWILVHMIDETARHVGHLDLLRDALTSS
ncbi:MAG TPA: DinB family protein [Ilumatobacteraceae bacterium]|nr:DinB family protein [Ilumatobacteraceae bacterium]